MKEKLWEKIKESINSVVPITLIVIVLSFFIVPIPTGMLGMFVFGAVLLILGMGLFTLGADIAMTPMGESMGAHMTRTGKLGIIAICCFVIGFIITIAEPDLQVLATQVPDVPKMVLIVAVALGVGVFLVIALLRMLFRWRLSYILMICYAVVFALAFFVPEGLISVAFDSGGVTTGPMTVPFIMALGVGLVSVRNDKDADSDSFGFIAICSIGPILAVLILSIIYSPESGSYSTAVIEEVTNSKELWAQFAHAFPEYFKEMLIALAPIAAFFFIYQAVALKLPKQNVIRIIVGLIYTYLGLVLFLTGVNVGFLPVGSYLGGQLALLDYNWIIIPIAMLMGYFIVSAEPAVHVLNKQVEEVTDGAIPSRAMGLSLSIGVAVSLGLSMIRVLTSISIFWFLIPGYAIALGLSFFVPKIFTAIAFDSGGVASGPMTATFVLPFAIGASEALGGNVLTDAFGTVAMVAMTPLITIQILGLYYKIKQRRAQDELPEDTDITETEFDDTEIVDVEAEIVDTEIIDFTEEA